MVITRGDSIGGAQLYVRDLAKRLQQDEHEVLVVTGTSVMLTRMLTAAEIPFTMCSCLQRQVHPLNDARAVRSLGRIIRAFKPDLLSAHSSKAGIIGRLAGKLNGVPCIFTAHGWPFAEGMPQPGRTIWRVIEQLSGPLAARIICVSTSDRQLALDCGFDPRRLVTIHNGIPDMPVPPRSPRDAGAPVRIAMVARFSPQKDHESLLRAIRDIPNCEVDFVGDGPLQESMTTLASRLGVRNRVRFHGYRSDVSSLLIESDLFVLASHYEGFPLTTLEAMRAGLPAIVSNAGGAGEAVIPGVSGYVVARGDVSALRGRIRTLVEHPNLRTAMGNAGRLLYLDSFTFERMYRSTLTVYEDIVLGYGIRGPRCVENDPGSSRRVLSIVTAWRSAIQVAGPASEHQPSYHRRRIPWGAEWD
ncbi:MAG: glycosyltransferase family 4 protein [Thermomicrobiales bacterium]